MVAIDIWVEGVADQKFLSDVLNVWFKLSFDKKKFEYRNESVAVRIRNGDGVSNFISIEGWDKIKTFFEENNGKSIKNLIIADADNGFKARKTEIAQTIKDAKFEPEMDLHLWPDNTSNGDLENLLEQIIHPDHQVIFECWKAYELCLNETPEKSYTTPARKTKIYAYLEALLGETKSEKEKIKERERNYANPDHWVLDGTKEPLKSLRIFLDRHLKSL